MTSAPENWVLPQSIPGVLSFPAVEIEALHFAENKHTEQMRAISYFSQKKLKTFSKGNYQENCRYGAEALTALEKPEPDSPDQ